VEILVRMLKTVYGDFGSHVEDSLVDILVRMLKTV
jgi:hypothetical protein